MADNFLNVGIQYEGLREIGMALRATNSRLADELKKDLMDVGDVVRDSARIEFVTHMSQYKRSAQSQASIQRTADGFHTRVRFSRGGSVVSIEQAIRKKTGTRPDYGSAMMKDGLLPARDKTLAQAARILEAGATRLLREHGIT